MLQDITEGLKQVHAIAFLYRDLKEDNIVLYKAGPGRVHAVLIDFGKCMPETSCSLYRLSESERETYRRKHRHVSPELVSGVSKPSTASDIYSLGRVIKHTILHSTIDSEAWPVRLQKICKLCLNVTPTARPVMEDIFNCDSRWSSLTFISSKETQFQPIPAVQLLMYMVILTPTVTA